MRRYFKLFSRYWLLKWFSVVPLFVKCDEHAWPKCIKNGSAMWTGLTSLQWLLHLLQLVQTRVGFSDASIPKYHAEDKYDTTLWRHRTMTNQSIFSLNNIKREPGKEQVSIFQSLTWPNGGSNHRAFHIRSEGSSQ